MNLRRVLFCILLLSPSLAPAQVLSRSFKHPRDAVWSAVVRAVANEGLRVKDRNREDGLVYLDFTYSGGGGLNVSNLVSMYTQKKTSIWSAWSVLQLLDSSSISVTDQAGSVLVSVNCRFVGFNNYSRLWEGLVSNGRLENIILNSTEKLLRDSPVVHQPPSEDVSAPLTGAATDAGAALIRSFRLIGASVENGVPAERVAELMADAQVNLEQFESSGGPAVVVGPLRLALKHYRGRDLEAARQAINEAARDLDSRRGPPVRRTGPGPILR